MKYYQSISITTFHNMPELNYGYMYLSEYDTGLELVTSTLRYDCAGDELERLVKRAHVDVKVDNSHEEFTTKTAFAVWES